MTERRDEFAGSTAERGQTVGVRPQTARGRSRLELALFVAGLVVVAANSALYFFGVESLSNPAVSVLALALLVPLYLRERPS